MCYVVEVKKLQRCAPATASISCQSPTGNIFGFYQNCRGLRTKILSFNCNTSHFNFIFIVLTETWLNSNFFSAELGLGNYTIYRCDRSSLSSASERGGGVLIAVRSDIPSFLLPTPDKSVEQLFVRFSLNSIHFLIGCVYLPPLCSIDLYHAHLTTVDTLFLQYPTHTFVLCGDYNLPLISWSNDANGLCYTSPTFSQYLCVPESFSLHGFFQLNYFPNSHGSLLDLIFANSKSISVSLALDSAVPPDSYHPPLTISLASTLPTLTSPSPLSFFNFSKADYPRIIDFFNSFNWERSFYSYSADDSMYIFLDALHSSILSFVPKVSIRRSNFPSWYTPELKNLVRLKNQAHAKYKSSLSLTDYRSFSLLRANFKFKSRECYRSYISRIESSLSSNPRYFWSFIRKSRSSSTIPSNLVYGDFSCSNPADAANLFSKFFSSIYSTSTSPLPSSSSTFSPQFSLPSCSLFTLDDVSKALCSLRNIKSVGPDGLQGHYLYMLRDVIAWPLFLLFRMSVESGVFPAALKIGAISPLLKSGDPNVVSNYRPITMLSNLSKLFESIVLKSIRLPLNHILVDEQHGFRPGRSTTTCNLALTSYIYDSFRARSQVDVIYTDFSKAFDLVDHSLLIKNLSILGIGDPLLSWLTSYLSNRYLYVSVHGSSSTHFVPSSGVPQGAVLSPLLFALFVNSAPSVLRHSKLLIFADDIKLYLRINSINDCSLLQQDLTSLVSWGESLGLSLNISKCSVFSFYRTHSHIYFPYVIHDFPIQPASEFIRDLGFTFTPDLSPILHIENMCCRALKILGFVLRSSASFQLLSPLKSLYCALVRPLLEYGSVLWDPSTACASASIERVQRKFLRIAAYRLNIPHPPHDYTSVLHALNISSLADRRHMSNLTFLSNLLSGKIDSPFLLSQINFKAPSRTTRCSDLFHIPRSSSNYLDNSPLVRLMRAANNDPSFSF